MTADTLRERVEVLMSKYEPSANDLPFWNDLRAILSQPSPAPEELRERVAQMIQACPRWDGEIDVAQDLAGSILALFSEGGPHRDQTEALAKPAERRWEECPECRGSGWVPVVEDQA